MLMLSRIGKVQEDGDGSIYQNAFAKQSQAPSFARSPQNRKSTRSVQGRAGTEKVTRERVYNKVVQDQGILRRDEE